MVQSDLTVVKDNVLVSVQQEVGLVLQPALPVLQAEEAVAKDHYGIQVVFADDVYGAFCPVQHGFNRQADHAWLVAQPVHRNHILISRLGEELR